MGPIHKAFKDELAKVPRALLLNLAEEKLRELQLDKQPGLSEALADHCLTGGGDSFVWDNPLQSKGPPRDLTISFSEKDVQRLHELANEFFKKLPSIIEGAQKDAAEIILKTLKSGWPQQYAYERDLLDGFKGRLETRWGKSFGLLRMLLTMCREIGQEKAARLRKSKARKNRVVRSLLVRKHARACQITAEIVTLMENGFADGAMARWRTLYEVGVVATVIADAGDAMAQKYIDHEVVESKFAMDEYARCHVGLGFKPIAARERHRVDRAFIKAVKVHGANFGKPYGWASDHLKKKKVTFRDLEDAAQRSSMRSYYKMASYNVHADTSKSIFSRLGVVGDQSIVIAGATDAGFTEPGQNAAIALVQITALLLKDKVSDFDFMIQLQAIVMIRDAIPEEFMRADRKLKRDHAKRQHNR
jgi:hypothetical protein